MADDRKTQEQRAAGHLPPVMDANTGQLINPHNPTFITNAPWYLEQKDASLQHQKAWRNKVSDTDADGMSWYVRGTKGDIKTRFIKGACENCGATTHTAKECTERPRARKAKYTGENLASDEYVQKFDMSFDAKRDKWNGYNVEDYKRDIVDEHEAREQIRQQKREREVAQKTVEKKKKKQKREDKSNDNSDSSDTSDSEKQKGFEDDAVGGSKNKQAKTTTRNLRIREDTAKYLINLDVNSAYYDPKSRSMRDNPRAGMDDAEKHSYQGDNFQLASGEAKEVRERQDFAWEAGKYGAESVHDIAAPTQTSILHADYKKMMTTKSDEKKNLLYEKYGGKEHVLNNNTKMILQSEYEVDTYQEYAQNGRLLEKENFSTRNRYKNISSGSGSGGPRVLSNSENFEEDLLYGEHTAVWGSWFDETTGKWGYTCCKSTNKMGAECSSMISSSTSNLLIEPPIGPILPN